MEGKGIFAAGAVTAVAIWLVLSLTATHDTERAEVRKRIERDSAEFDRDFARMTQAPEDQQKELTDRAKETGKELAEIKQAAKERQELEQAKRDEVQAGYEKEINLDVGHVKAKLAETKAEAASKLKNVMQ